MKRSKKGICLMSLGALLLSGACVLAGYNIYGEYNANHHVKDVIAQLPRVHYEKADEREIADYVLNPDMEMLTQTIDGEDYVGILDIPALNLSLPIISEWSYPRMLIAPCVFQGSPYKDNFILASHNYRAHFGYIYQLEPDDQLIFTDLEGNEFIYKVLTTQLLQPNELDVLITGEWDLTLFTCNYAGDARIVLRCERVNP